MKFNEAVEPKPEDFGARRFPGTVIKYIWPSEEAKKKFIEACKKEGKK